MPKIGFDCDCGFTRFDVCLKECPQGVRCLSRPTLVELAKTRPYTDEGSTTDLLNGTRYSLLCRIVDYYVDPQSGAFMLLGTHHHDKLEQNVGKNELAEEWIGDAHTDLYDGIEETLWDYKTAGSFKVAKSVGMDFEMVDHPDGEVYKTSGKHGKAGDIKRVKNFFENREKADMFDWIMQLNRYRLDYEKAGFPVKHLKVQVTVRDGGTATALQRGVSKNIYVIDIPIIDNEEVENYFSYKQVALKKALKERYAPRCNQRESWDGIRCSKHWCPVFKECEEMGE